MAITHTETIESLTILNTPDNVVCEVGVAITSEDDSDPENLRMQSTDTYTVDTDEVDPESESFIPYESLTEETVMGWIAEELSKSNTKINQASWIESVKNPPAPARVNMNIPW
jgi:hypothetical protein